MCLAVKGRLQGRTAKLLLARWMSWYYDETLHITPLYIYLKVIIILPWRNNFTPLFSFISCLNYSKIIKRTHDILYALCSNMCIYLSCLAALMSQQFLYIPQIRTRFKQMRGITVPQTVNTNILFNTCPMKRLLKTRYTLSTEYLPPLCPSKRYFTG
jgi:hypothetical protein